MKKFLFLLFSLAVVSASAGINKAPLKSNKVAAFNDKVKTEFVSPFKMSHEIKSNSVLRAPITEQPAGEVKTYLRSGECLSVEGDYVEHLTQDGFVTLIFAEDNIVWFKNIFYKVDENFGESYVYGVLSEDGTKITVPMGQSIYWSDYYSADVVLSFGTSSVGSNIVWTPDESVTEVVYAIDGNKITLQGCGGAAPSGSNYPEYEYNGLGSVWTDDGTFGGYLEWETVFTFVVVPDVPEVTVEPGSTTADVTWGADEKADGYNLRWRPWKDLSGNPHEWNFTLQGYEDDLNEGWWIYDANGDGYNWAPTYSSNAQDDVCLYSFSWSSSSGGITPDNYIGTPDVPLKGVLRFEVWGVSDSWPDTYQVYAMVGEDLYQLFEENQETTAAHQTVEVDLSVFDGAEGCIVFRHYNCTNQYGIYIDNVFIGDPDSYVEPAPWNYENKLDANEFTIEGLTPETTYEVQVQGYNEDFTGDWCDIVEFTTLAEAPVIPDVYMLGGDDQEWDPTQGIKFNYNEEDNTYTLTYTFPAETNYFGFTTMLAEENIDNGGWNVIAPYRFGAVADPETDFIWFDEYDGLPLDLTWVDYHAFQIAGGDYKMTVNLTTMKIIIEKQAPAYVLGDVNKDGLVNISDVTALIDHLLASDFEEAEDFSFLGADVDASGGINIADVTGLIDLLLGGGN